MSDLQVLWGVNTPIRCTECGTEEAATYYLKRRRGLYAVLCFQNGQGCWERSARTMCEHRDTMTQYQCMLLAEWEIRRGKNGDSRTLCCSGHLSDEIPADYDAMHVFPLED